MAWNPSPKVADCREIARKWGVDEVIILAVNKRNETLEYASFGKTRQLCDEAWKLAQAAYDGAYNKLADLADSAAHLPVATGGVISPRVCDAGAARDNAPF